jgi:hypothetical protein
MPVPPVADHVSRFQIPLIKPNMQLSRIRLLDKVADAIAHP